MNYNRLKSERSPYLLQHAENPVNWYPWCEEAFEAARRRDMPVFLSIGYSTCHWCHVMERESFENESIAAIMNENFISIKVDREDRPDIDHLYMNALHAMGSAGGWPLSMFLTPDRKPFFGGTYFPPIDRAGMNGFATILNLVARGWKSDRSEIVKHAGAVINSLQQPGAGSHELPDAVVLHHATDQFKSHFDPIFGGFSESVKFPMAPVLSFLLRYGHRFQNSDAHAMATHTLDRIASGGIRDYLAGGFHRYATDREWLVPHFEKMLYDQALLAMAFTDAFLITGSGNYRTIVKETLDYMTNYLRHPRGGYYCAEDADSEGSEGTFYLWSRQEILDILGANDGRLFCEFYGITENGNFEGQNILVARVPTERLAQSRGVTTPELVELLERCKSTLCNERNKRIRPFRDEKIVVDWNGLAISALSYAGRALGEPELVEGASDAAAFILENMRSGKRLYRSWCKGKTGDPGLLTDYAFLCTGLIDLYEATFEERRLAEARSLCDEIIRLFWDKSGGGFFITPRDGEKLPVDSKDSFDGVQPSGNTAALMALVRMEHFTDDPDLGKIIDATFRVFAHDMKAMPSAYPAMLSALDYHLGPRREAVVATGSDEAAARVFINEIYRHYHPRTIVLLHRMGEKGRLVETIAPFVRNMGPYDGKTALYLCEDRICNLPVTESGKAREPFGG